jgi:hypothetical protein
VKDVTPVADVEYIDRRAGLRRLLWPSRSVRHRHLTAAVSDLLGVPVGIALPLQRRRPALIFVTCVAELAALGAAVITGNAAALLILALLATALVGIAAANDRRILAITSTGLVVLAASSRGRPVAMIDTAPKDLTLPAPAALGVPIRLRDQTWWVDRAAFPRLVRARQLLGDGAPGAPGQRATGGEWPGSSS